MTFTKLPSQYVRMHAHIPRHMNHTALRPTVQALEFVERCCGVVGRNEVSRVVAWWRRVLGGGLDHVSKWQRHAGTNATVAVHAAVSVVAIGSIGRFSIDAIVCHSPWLGFLQRRLPMRVWGDFYRECVA